MPVYRPVRSGLTGLDRYRYRSRKNPTGCNSALGMAQWFYAYEFRDQKVRFLPPARCHRLQDVRYRKNKQRKNSNARQFRHHCLDFDFRSVRFHSLVFLSLFVIVVLSVDFFRKRPQKLYKKITKKCMDVTNKYSA